MPVPPDKPLGVLLAIAGTGQAADLHLHQPLRGEADHLPQQIGVRGLLDQRLQVHRLVGHRSVPRIRLCPQPDLDRRTVDDHHKPLACYRAVARASLAAMLSSYTITGDTTVRTRTAIPPARKHR
ncbi:hypothetical protein [Parvibaculum sp.]|uniref:hypothetical protein n=1 Tax=Parvibaculum sp. TaxID=2024848 RepID=UPI00329708C4